MGKSKEKKEKREKKSKKSSRKEGKKDKVRRTRPSVKLTADDYYLQANPFRVYLRSQGKNFETLSSEAARRHFDKFCKAYNKGKLNAMFYSGSFPSSLLGEATHTQHRWGMSLTDADKQLLQATTQTVRQDGDSLSAWGDQPVQRQQQLPQVKPRVATLQDAVATAELHGIDTDKPTSGHAALAAKRKERGDAIHSSHKEREDLLSGPELPDSVVLGGDSSEDLAFLKHRQAQRQSKQADRIAALQEREQQRDDAWKAQLGIPTDGRRITIAPRPPPS